MEDECFFFLSYDKLIDSSRNIQRKQNGVPWGISVNECSMIYPVWDAGQIIGLFFCLYYCRVPIINIDRWYTTSLKYSFQIYSLISVIAVLKHVVIYINFHRNTPPYLINQQYSNEVVSIYLYASQGVIKWYQARFYIIAFPYKSFTNRGCLNVSFQSIIRSSSGVYLNQGARTITSFGCVYCRSTPW